MTVAELRRRQRLNALFDEACWLIESLIFGLGLYTLAELLERFPR